MTPGEQGTAAPDAGAPSWQYQLAMFAITALGLILAAAVPLVAKAVARKYHLENEQIIADRTQDVVQLGVQFVEEQLAKRAKAGLDKPTSDEKIDIATAFILNQLKESKLPERSASTIKNLIEAKLPEMRAEPPKAS